MHSLPLCIYSSFSLGARKLWPIAKLGSLFLYGLGARSVCLLLFLKGWLQKKNRCKEKYSTKTVYSSQSWKYLLLTLYKKSLSFSPLWSPTFFFRSGADSIYFLKESLILKNFKVAGDPWNNKIVCFTKGFITEFIYILILAYLYNYL